MKKDLPDNQTDFLLYTGNDGKVNVEVFLKDETVWLTQKAMAELFGRAFRGQNPCHQQAPVKHI